MVLAIVVSGVIVGALGLADFLMSRARTGCWAAFEPVWPWSVPRSAQLVRFIPDDRVDVSRDGVRGGAWAVGVPPIPSDRHLSFLIAALALVAEAIVFTFTRAGLITVALSLAIVGASQWMRYGFGRTTRVVCVVALIAAIELLSSRSLEMLALRLTTEGQGRWFSAVFEVPSRVTLDTRTPIDIPITITNTGRATWDWMLPSRSSFRITGLRKTPTRSSRGKASARCSTGPFAQGKRSR